MDAYGPVHKSNFATGASQINDFEHLTHWLICAQARARAPSTRSSGKQATIEGLALSSSRSGSICQPRRSSIRLLSATSARRTAPLGTRKLSTAGRECGRSWMKPSSLRHPQKRKARRPTSGRALRSCTHISLRAARGRHASVPTHRARCTVEKGRYPCLAPPAWLMLRPANLVASLRARTRSRAPTRRGAKATCCCSSASGCASPSRWADRL